MKISLEILILGNGTGNPQVLLSVPVHIPTTHGSQATCQMSTPIVLFTNSRAGRDPPHEQLLTAVGCSYENRKRKREFMQVTHGYGMAGVTDHTVSIPTIHRLMSHGSVGMGRPC